MDKEGHTKDMAVPQSEEVEKAVVAVAEELYNRIQPHLSLDHLEVEMRLCRFALPDDSITDKNEKPKLLLECFPHGLTKGRISTSLPEAHFRILEGFVTASKVQKGDQAHRRTTEDIKCRNARYTYEIDGDTRILRETTVKSRKAVEDVRVRADAYDLRLSVNVETPAAAPDALPQHPPRGYTRHKQRTSVVDGCYRYDLTEVTAREGKSYEVEVEASLEGGGKPPSVAWLTGLLRRMMELAAHPNLKGVKSASPAVSKRVKRLREE